MVLGRRAVQTEERASAKEVYEHGSVEGRAKGAPGPAGGTCGPRRTLASLWVSWEAQQGSRRGRR